jgi:hypothetical protein
MDSRNPNCGLWDFPAAFGKALHSETWLEHCILTGSGVRCQSAGKSKWKSQQGGNMRLVCVIAVLTFPVLASAQKGPCTEQVIKDVHATVARTGTPDLNLVTDDTYFYSGALNKPVVGKQAYQDAFKPVDAERKNAKYTEKVDRIVASPSGGMAYEYGTEHIIYDDKSGHNDFTAAYLAVWKADKGACKRVGAMYKEIPSSK